MILLHYKRVYGCVVSWSSFFFADFVLDLFLLAGLLHPGERLVFLLLLQRIMAIEPFVLLIVVFLLILFDLLGLESKLEVDIFDVKHFVQTEKPSGRTVSVRDY